ncbi:hypothetical protein RB601_000036 [Gaeumannomyces tritici]
MESAGGKQSGDGSGDADRRQSKDASGAPPPPHSDEQSKTPKKRRKVNHACVYCRRSHMTCDLERPCTRCIKRNIGHLCHDEPREHETKKAKSSTMGASTVDETETQSDMAQSSVADQGIGSMGPPPPFDHGMDSGGGTQAGKPTGFGAMAPLGQGNPLLVQQQASRVNVGAPSGLGQFAGFSDAWFNQNHFHEMHSYHPSYNLITPEVTNEFNLLSDFLHGSLLEDGALLDDQMQGITGTESALGLGLPGRSGGADAGANSMLPPSVTSKDALMIPQADKGKAISRPGSVVPIDKAREYYLQAADPSGNDTPEARMQRLLKAKYDAGLLKPFNYVNGYARLNSYLDSHIAASSKQKILRQLDKFRPKFREKVHALTDMELVFVEMWFEKTLMDYDRVFASMAIPACCWRRTGEIFRGNKEMAELINVPVDSLRDGKIALHEILTEESVVRYWEEFGTIAFDPAHDTLLTACSLKNPDDKSKEPPIKCCFSLKIRRDDHKIPSLIVGNFLPHDPPDD